MRENELQSANDQNATLRQIVDCSPALLHTARPDGYLDFFNQTWLDFAGEPLEKLLGWGWTSCIHPDDVQLFVQRMRDSYAKGVPFQETSRVRRADGQYRWMQHNKVPLRNKNGTIVKWHGSSIDIEEQKQAEDELRRNTQRLQTSEFYLAEAQRLGHIGSWVFEPAGTFEYWSDELFHIYDLDPKKNPPSVDEYLGRVHPFDREFMAALIKRILAAGEGCDVTKRIIRPNGEVRHIRWVGTPVLEYGALKRIVGNAIDVTEYMLLIQERRRREAYLAEAQSLSRTGSFGWRTHNNTIVWSAETYRIFEIDPATEISLETILSLVHPKDRALVTDALKRASSESIPVDFKHRLLFSDNRVKYLRVLARPLDIDSDGLEFAGAVIDITEAKKADQALRKNERELRTTIEIIPAYVAVTLPDGTVDFVTQSWLDYTGFTREQAMGWGWTKAIHPDDHDRAVANWRAALDAGEPLEQEVRARKADGTYRWFLNRNLPLRDENGTVMKWYGILFDIDVLKKTENALQMREHELLHIIDTIPSMLWAASPAGEITHVNQTALEYSGLRFEDFPNWGWKQFIHPEDAEDTAKVFSHSMQTGESINLVHRLRRADGEYRWHHARGEPLRGPDGDIVHWYGLSTDIDERKRAEDHLRDARLKLAQASRIAIVAELSASIAHELNQPLMSIFANAQAAKRWLSAIPQNMEEVDTSIERILRDARAADETMQHIRALFKQKPFDKREANVADMLTEAVRFVHEDPKKCEIPIDCHFNEPLPPLLVDTIQIQQVFINLILNAIEALQGSPISPLIVLRAEAADRNQIIVQVIDNGPGVKDTERIFDAFVTTKEKGMGIGLAVSRSIVETHGGRIWVENHPDGGARFSVALPVSSETTRHGH